MSARAYLAELTRSYPFLSKVLLLSSGTVLGQAILVGALPILTRLYSVEEMGILGIAMTAATIAAMPACLRLELAIAIPRTATAAIQLLGAGIVAASAIFAILTAFVLVAPDLSAAAIGSGSGEAYLIVIVASGWFLALYSALQFWSIRQGRIREASTTQLSRAIGSVAIQIGLGFIGAGAAGLVFGFLGYCVIGTLSLAFILVRKDWPLLKRLRWNRMKWAVLSNRKYIAYSVPHAFLNTVALSGPILVFAALGGKAEAGWLVLAMRVTAIPIGFIGSSLSRIYLTDAARKHESGELRQFTLSLMRTLALYGLPLFTAIMILSPLAFPMVFGEEWTRSGYMVALLCPGLFLQFICSPVSTAFVVCKRMDVAFWLQLAGAVIVILPLFLASHLFDSWLIESLALSFILYYGAYLFVLIAVVAHTTRESDAIQEHP